MYELLTIYEFQIQMSFSMVHHLVHREEGLEQEHLYHLQPYQRQYNFLNIVILNCTEKILL